MTWRDIYKVHPAADVFPMMSDAELAELGEDIKKNGLSIPILFWGMEEGGPWLIDGRNRCEAAERIGMDPHELHAEHFFCKDPLTHIITLNIHRRHLTKQQQADLIVAAHKAAAEASRQLGEVPNKRHVKGKAGSAKDEIKAAVVADANKHGIGKRTVERSIAKAEGKPKPVQHKVAQRPLPKPKSGAPLVGIDAARRYYLDRCAEPDIDLDAEQDIIIDGLREIAGKRMMSRARGAR